MPVHKTDGGYQYGDTGKVYKGNGAHAKAVKQASAVHAREADATKGGRKGGKK